ncbi:hypothetical protein Tco_1442387 [Tanacetum coccineum]
MENEDVRMNHRCLALLLNQLSPKEKDPGSFILPCSIERLDFNNALADLGASISVMPFSMYKHLGIRNLETIKMNIELADNSKYTLTSLPPQPIGVATKASNLQRIPSRVQGRSHFIYFCI